MSKKVHLGFKFYGETFYYILFIIENKKIRNDQ